LSLSARERLDLNISSTFVELALTTLNTWFQEGSDAVLHAARGAYAPYRIRNQTGSPILVWSESDNTASHSVDPVKILNDQIIDWRFDDWKTMREVGFSPTTIDDLLKLCLPYSTSPQLSITLAYNLSKSHGNNCVQFQLTVKGNLFIHCGLKQTNIRIVCYAK